MNSIPFHTFPNVLFISNPSIQTLLFTLILQKQRQGHPNQKQHYFSTHFRYPSNIYRYRVDLSKQFPLVGQPMDYWQDQLFAKYHPNYPFQLVMWQSYFESIPIYSIVSNLQYFLAMPSICYFLHQDMSLKSSFPMRLEVYSIDFLQLSSFVNSQNSSGNSTIKLLEQSNSTSDVKSHKHFG